MANPTSSGGHSKPGKVLSHYMPSRTVNLSKTDGTGTILLDFDPDCRIVSNMSETKRIASVPGHAADSGSSRLAFHYLV
jgi:hypothetical protein